MKGCCFIFVSFFILMVFLIGICRLEYNLSLESGLLYFLLLVISLILVGGIFGGSK